MKVILIPGDYNVSLVQEAKRLLMIADEDERSLELDAFVECNGPSAAYDAMYYACSNGAEQLREQASYLCDTLFWDKREHYLGRMAGISN